MTKVNGKSTNNNENIQNWSSVKGTYQSNKSCPTYVNVYDNGVLSNTKVWAFYNQSDATASATQNKATILDSVSAGLNASDTEKNNVSSRVSEIANYCNSIASTNYDMNSCKNTSNITTKYDECKKDANSKLSMINSYASEVSG